MIRFLQRLWLLNPLLRTGVLEPGRGMRGNWDERHDLDPNGNYYQIGHTAPRKDAT